MRKNGNLHCSFVIVLTCFIKLAFSITHWRNEQGSIRSKVFSEYHLRQPSNLVLFIKNENDWKKLKEIKGELDEEKKELEVEKEEEKTDLVSKYYKEDSDCLAARKPLKSMDFHLSTIIPLESFGVRYKEHLDLMSELPHKLVEPFCAADLPFSMITMDHLEGLIKRDQLKSHPEKDLKKFIFTEFSLEDIGQRIRVALDKNETSWVLLNLAALYWRINGNSFEAIECLRRALFYSVRNTRGIALVSLANVLHHTGYSKDAITVLIASFSLDGDKRINYFTLGNILASLGRYVAAEKWYRNTLEVQHDFTSAKQRLHAVLCERKLQRDLEKQHEILKDILEQMEKYQKKQKQYDIDEAEFYNGISSEEDQQKKNYQFRKYLLSR